MANLLGLLPTQVPAISDIGRSAFVDSETPIISGISSQLTDTTDTGPSLLIDLARGKTCFPGTFGRGSKATYADKNGFIKIAPLGTPRFDHDPITGLCKGLLIEEARTNLCTQIDFDSLGITVASNSTDSHAPDGSFTAYKFTEIAANLQHNVFLRSSSSATIGTTYTASAFIKPIACSRQFVVHKHGEGLVTVNLDDTFSPNAQAGAIKYPNGWYRVWATFTAGGTVNSYYFNPKGTVGAYMGDTATSYLFWGPQIEVGNFLTSYIPFSTSSTVTRAIDQFYINGLNSVDFGCKQAYTLGIDFYMASDTGGSSPRIAYMDGDTTFNALLSTSDTDAASSFFGNGVSVLNSNRVSGLCKTAQSFYSSTDVDPGFLTSFSCNGIVNTAQTRQTIYGAFNMFNKNNLSFIPGNVAGQGSLLGPLHISKVYIYPRRLSDLELKEITK